MQSCPSCGKSVADGAAFCGYCGAGTTAPAASDSPGGAVLRSDADYWICGSCHAENLVGDAFCQTCGLARVSVSPSVAPPHVAAPTAVPAAGMDVVAHGLVCTSCGTANEPDASFCHVCGVPLVAKTVSHSSQPVWGTPSPAPKTPRSARWIVLAAVIVAVAAAVVIGVVLVGGRGDGGEGSEAAVEAAAAVDSATVGSSGGTSDSTTSSTTPTERDVTGNVTSARATSCLDQDGRITYRAENLVDGSMTTCWAEGVSGFGIGESVRFKFSPRMNLTRMEVVPGYDKYANGWDRWYSNGRLREITVTFADGSQESFAFSDENRWQACDFSSLKTGSTLEFTIESVYPADSDHPRYAEDTSVSEVRFYGWHASEGGE